MARRIAITPYDPHWPRLYAAERDRLSQVLAPILIRVHHVGSTSVPGLAAKPVIDILIEVSDDARLPQFDPGIAALGYTPRGECLDAGGTPGRYYYTKNTKGQRSHQLHICQEGHWEIAAMLAFPRYLWQHPDVAARYQRVKEQAAAAHRYDIVGYIAAKNDFIRTILAAAGVQVPEGV